MSEQAQNELVQSLASGLGENSRDKGKDKKYISWNIVKRMLLVILVGGLIGQSSSVLQAAQDNPADFTHPANFVLDPLPGLRASRLNPGDPVNAFYDNVAGIAPGLQPVTVHKYLNNKYQQGTVPTTEQADVLSTTMGGNFLKNEIAYAKSVNSSVGKNVLQVGYIITPNTQFTYAIAAEPFDTTFMVNSQSVPTTVEKGSMIVISSDGTPVLLPISISGDSMKLITAGDFVNSLLASGLLPDGARTFQAAQGIYVSLQTMRDNPGMYVVVVTKKNSIQALVPYGHMLPDTADAAPPTAPTIVPTARPIVDASQAVDINITATPQDADLSLPGEVSPYTVFTADRLAAMSQTDGVTYTVGFTTTISQNHHNVTWNVYVAGMDDLTELYFNRSLVDAFQLQGILLNANYSLTPKDIKIIFVKGTGSTHVDGVAQKLGLTIWKNGEAQGATGYSGDALIFAYSPQIVNGHRENAVIVSDAYVNTYIKNLHGDSVGNPIPLTVLFSQFFTDAIIASFKLDEVAESGQGRDHHVTIPTYFNVLLAFRDAAGGDVDVALMHVGLSDTPSS